MKCSNPNKWDWEDEDFDYEDVTFQKLTHKTKLTKQREKDVIRQKRKEKLRKQSYDANIEEEN